ncbi:MAG: hypothetical protein ABEJ83_00485, partial [Candidatus Nanohaloarchaea archaeon]
PRPDSNVNNRKITINQQDPELTMNILSKILTDRKAMGWSMRVIMALFLAIAFGALIMPYLLPTIFGAQTTTSCQSPYMQALSSVIADAVDQGTSPC